MVDDLPVGGGGGSNPFGAGGPSMMDEQPPAQAAANADDDKPLEERLVSKAWAVRKTAFEELQGIISKFDLATDNALMNEHISKWPKYLVDPNPGALETVLACFQVYIDKCEPRILASIQDKIYAPIIDKCLGAAKPTIKAKAMESMLLYFEVSENFSEETLDAFHAQVKSPKPKIAATSMTLLAALMTAYGIKRFSPARFGKQIEAAANSSAPATRNEAMNCYKAIFQWAGEEVTQPFIDKLKDAQKVQLQKDFEAIKAEKKEFKRRTRTEQESAKQDAVNALAEESKEEEKIDVYDLSAAAEILGKFGPDWATATLAMKKWNEKKDALDALITEANVPKLAEGDYSGLFEVLKKLAGDAHATVAQHAIKAIGFLASGLRASFHDFAIQAVPVCFVKFKEKRLTEDILTALEKVMMCCSLGEILDHFSAIKTEKTPHGKISIAVFLERTIRTTYIDPLEEVSESVAKLAVQISEDTNAGLRDQGLIILGVLLARVPGTTGKFVDPLIDAKKAKVNAAKEEVKITKYDKSEKAAAAAAKKKAAAAKAKPKAAAAAGGEEVKMPAKKKAVAMTFGGDDEPMKDESSAAAGDNVLIEVAPSAPKRPPPNIGKKPASNKPAAAAAAAGDDEALAQPDPPKKGPPARLAARAAGAAAAGPAKTVKASDIQEEDIGAGMGKETAIEKVGEFYAAEHVAQFEEAKWQEKQKGFTGLKEQIEQLKPDKVMVEATAKFVKAKMKDWKESNLVMMKEAIQVLLLMTQHCEDVPKRAVATYAPFVCEKIGDIKLNGPIKEALLNCAEFCTAKFISIQLVKKGLDTKAPNNVKESCNLLAQIVKEFGAGRVAIKETIDFGIHSANHANKQVRDASMALFAEIYKHLGDKMMKFLEGVKPNTMQLIEAEFAKVTPYAKGEFQSTRQVKGEAAEEVAASGGGGKGGDEPDALAALEGSIPRNDISKLLTAKLLKQFEHADWKEKVKGFEAVQKILQENGMRIKPDGIGDLMDHLKNLQKDKNKAVLKQVILLMGAMAEATGKEILTYNKRCLKPLLAFLGDKAALMRQDVIATADKWKESIGAEHIINSMCTYLGDGNPELRSESLKWINANKASISKCDLQAMIKPLILCLTDRSGPIRTMADEAIVETMCHVGAGAFTEGIRDLKPAIQQTVRPLLEKAKQKAIAANPDAANVEAPEPAADAGPKKPTAAAKKTGAAAAKPGAARPGTAIRGGGGAAKAEAPPQASPAKATAAASAAPTRKTIPSKTTAAPAPRVQAQEAEVLEINPGNKERRALADSKSKWVHDDVKPQHVSAVKKHSEEIFGLEVSTMMWSADFKKHMQVIGKILTLINTQPDELMGCVDVIFKWTSIKLGESNNTAFQGCVYDFYLKLFAALIEKLYLFWEHEADVVLPLLADKVGNNNAILKGKVKEIIKMCFELHDPKKTLLYLIKFGAQNKNLKSASESLDEIACYLRTSNQVPLGEQQIKVIAKLVDSKDAAVRENALQVLSEIYKVLDEDIWRVVGQVPIKVKGLIEQRFKKVKGLGSSSSNMNKSISNKMTTPRANKVSPRGSKAASSSGQQELTKSFNPGLKNSQTPRTQGLKFGAKPDDTSVDESSGQAQQQQQMTRSFRPGTAQQSNLTRSFNQREGVRAFNASRPQTAAVSKQVSEASDPMRNTLPPPMSNNDDADLIGGGLGRNTEINFHPPQNNEMHFMDDDEDLRQQIQEMEGPKKEPLSPRTQKQVDDIMKYISNLKYSSDLNKRVESLISLNDIIQAIQSHEKSIQHTANDLISAFTHVLIDIFERPRQETPLRFAKYFVTIVNKTCQCSIIMSVVREQELYELGEQLLTRLLIDNLDKLGDEKEGEFILKNLNGSMLRCLENCNKTSIFCVLFNLLRRYKDNSAQVRMPGLIIKCLLKLSKILEKVITELEIERVLIVIHLYLISLDHENKTSNDEMGIRIVKTLVHEMVKVKQHSIMDAYKVVERHEVEDKHLRRWIKIILNTIEPTGASAASGAGNSGAQTDREMQVILQELRQTDTFQEAIPKLHNFMQKNPQLSLDYQIRELSAGVQQMIKQSLQAYINQLSDSGSTPNGTQHAEQPQDRPSPSFSSSFNSQAKAEQTQSKRFVLGQTRTSDVGQGSDFSMAAKGVASSAGGTSSTTQLRATQPVSASNRQTLAGSQAVGAETSTDRVNTYQSKLSSMREKFQQRKTLTGGTTETQKASSMAANASNARSSNNLSTSFSAMNTSLQHKWKAAQSKQTTARDSAGPSQQFSATMVGGGATSSSRFSTEVAGQGASQNLASSNSATQATPGQAGASNQDLNKRLLELKGKLAALKK